MKNNAGIPEIKVHIPQVLKEKLETFARVCGREPDDLIRVALDDYFYKVTVLPEPVIYQLPDGLWAVEAVEPGIETVDREGDPLLLARFYGTLDRNKDREKRLMSALIALKGLTDRASPLEIMNADWVSMKRDIGGI